jgi:glycosyltransferase involved in cell wall biosynthesis
MNKSSNQPPSISLSSNNLRIFQNAGIYRTYRLHFDEVYGTHNSFKARVQDFLNDRYGALHFLQPVLCGSPEAFFTNGDDEILQRQWAKEQGLPVKTSITDILLAQIESHRAEVFYNLDPMRYGNDVVRRLPSCVRWSLAWRAAPSPGMDFSAYDVVLCNFPSILDSYRQKGWRTAYFSPAHDPVMDFYAIRRERPVDVLFVGGYTRHHKRRAELLEAVASMAKEFQINFHLEISRMTHLAESPVGQFIPIGRQHRRSPTIRSIAKKPVFGLELYEALSRAKIVLNGAIDMSGSDRGNMRCFEAMGCGAVMVSDDGNYPEGMIDGVNMIAYHNPVEAVERIRALLMDGPLQQRLAKSGRELMSTAYTKAAQWKSFLSIVESL